MNKQIDPSILDLSTQALRKHWPEASPRCGVVLGSGWGEAIAHLDGETIPYTDIPGLGLTSVMGHAGTLLRTTINGMETWIFQGRRHWYEGEGWTPVILPTYLLHSFGATHLLLTNASGGIREDLGPGSLVALSDHINMLGSNPLIGPHRPQLGTRFPDQSEVYTPSLRELLKRAGADAEGVYIATSGPTFETPAEIRQYRAMGADLVGMSTVPEAIIANALGMQVAALSCVCNWAAGISPVKLTHEDVNQVATQTMPRMTQTITTFLEKLAHATG